MGSLSCRAVFADVELWASEHLMSHYNQVVGHTQGLHRDLKETLRKFVGFRVSEN